MIHAVSDSVGYASLPRGCEIPILYYKKPLYLNIGQLLSTPFKLPAIQAKSRNLSLIRESFVARFI